MCFLSVCIKKKKKKTAKEHQTETALSFCYVLICLKSLQFSQEGLCCHVLERTLLTFWQDSICAYFLPCFPQRPCSATVAFPDEETWSHGSCGCQAAHGSLALPSLCCLSSEGCVALLCSWECLQSSAWITAVIQRAFVLTWLSFITELISAHFTWPPVECRVEGTEPEGNKQPFYKE